MGRLTLLLLCLLTSTVCAQYYERSFDDTPHRVAHAGFFLRDFDPRASNSLPDSLRISYSRVMPAIGFRQGLVDLTFGYTRFTLRGDSKTAIFAAVTIANELPLAFGREHSLLLPFQISSDYTRADNTGGDKENFSIGSVGIGAGLKYRYRQPSFEFSIHAVEAAHWALEGFSTGSGFSAATMGEASFTFRDAVVLDGVMLGYRFRYQTWNMSNAKFNYNSLSHGAFLGILF